MTGAMDPKAIPSAVVSLCKTLASHGERSWIVGGCVRDQLLGRAVNDWDLCTTARPEALMKVFPKAIATGLQHGTITVVVARERYEITTLRGDGAYTDGRRPDSVVFLDDITEDLARRDFTVNAIAYDVLGSALVDPFRGADDLAAKVLRAVGDPHRRFHEDGLRILRGARFSATLGFSIDPATEEAMEGAIEVFRKVSPERVRDEWSKALKAEKPSRAFEVMRRRGILAVTLPALQDANEHHFALALEATDAAPRSHPNVRLAALLTALKTTEQADAWLKAYRYSNEERTRVTHLLAHRGFSTAATDSDATVRRAVRAIGLDALDEVFMLRRAMFEEGEDLDVYAEEALDELKRHEARVNALRAQGIVMSTRELAVDGATLMKELGIPPSRRLGKILEVLLERVTDEPRDNTRERLLAIAREVDPGATP